MSISKCSGVSRLLFLLKISPATEKTLSDGTLVAGIHKYLLESLYNVGNFSLFCFHQVNASNFLFTTGSYFKNFI